jgi:hypothetical protein
MVADGAAAAGTVVTTEDGVTGTQAIIVGTAAGDGGAAVLIHGGCFSRQSFQFRILTLTTADMAMGRDMDTVQVTATGRDMDTEEVTDRVISSLRHVVLRSPEIARQYPG